MIYLSQKLYYLNLIITQNIFENKACIFYTYYIGILL
jgi:hypothetical protein